jgi:hypothetical protein
MHCFKRRQLLHLLAVVLCSTWPKELSDAQQELDQKLPQAASQTTSEDINSMLTIQHKWDKSTAWYLPAAGSSTDSLGPTSGKFKKSS